MRGMVMGVFVEKYKKSPPTCRASVTQMKNSTTIRESQPEQDSSEFLLCMYHGDTHTSDGYSGSAGLIRWSDLTEPEGAYRIYIGVEAMISLICDNCKCRASGSHTLDLAIKKATTEQFQFLKTESGNPLTLCAKFFIEQEERLHKFEWCHPRAIVQIYAGESGRILFG